jgi:hypothetical protein
MVHATIGHKAKHGPKFRDCALAIGLEGKMTATTPSAKMSEFAEAFIKKHGPYPAGNISALKGPTKQTTRLLKCECPECGYVVRTTAKWLEDAGAPYCGIKSHGRMGTEYESEGEE